MTVLLDPTAGKAAASIETVPRPKSLDGLTVGLLDISKPRGDIVPRSTREAPRRTRRDGQALREADLHQAGARRSPPRDRQQLRRRRSKRSPIEAAARRAVCTTW